MHAWSLTIMITIPLICILFSSLVINNNPDLVAVKYMCKADGYYLTPKGIAAGDPWPICTTKPVRPRKQSLYIYLHKFELLRI